MDLIEKQKELTDRLQKVNEAITALKSEAKKLTISIGQYSKLIEKAEAIEVPAKTAS